MKRRRCATSPLRPVLAWAHVSVLCQQRGPGPGALPLAGGAIRGAGSPAPRCHHRRSLSASHACIAGRDGTAPAHPGGAVRGCLESALTRGPLRGRGSGDSTACAGGLCRPRHGGRGCPTPVAGGRSRHAALRIAARPRAVLATGPEQRDTQDRGAFTVRPPRLAAYPAALTTALDRPDSGPADPDYRAAAGTGRHRPIGSASYSGAAHTTTHSTAGLRLHMGRASLSETPTRSRGTPLEIAPRRHRRQ